MITELKPEHIENIMKIHFTCFKNDISSKLGYNFLKKLYISILKDTRNFGYVYIKNHKVVGYIVFVYNRKDIIKKNWFSLGISLIPRLIKPKVLRFLFENFTRQSSGKEYPEVFSIAVLPEYRNLISALSMYSKLIEEVKKRNIPKLTAVILASNKPSIELHKRLGFNRCRTFFVAGEERSKWIFEME